MVIYIISHLLVLTLEAVNTAIECVVDLVTMDYHELAKQAKDIAAFSVMLVSIFALITGLVVFFCSYFLTIKGCLNDLSITLFSKS